MIINKKYTSIFLFMLCSSASLFSSYFFLHQDNAKEQGNNFLRSDILSKHETKEVHMPIIDKSVNTDIFNKSVILTSERHNINPDENIGFLKLNKKVFLEQLKTFVHQKIVQKNQQFLINADNTFGKIFYSFVDNNSLNVVVKWKNNSAPNSQVFYDNWYIFVDY